MKSHIPECGIVRLTAIVAILTMTGCGLSPIRITANKPDPIDVHADPSCFAPCTEKAPPITEDPDSAVLAAIIGHEYQKLCEVRRQACAEAIKRGVEAGAIK